MSNLLKNFRRDGSIVKPNGHTTEFIVSGDDGEFATLFVQTSHEPTKEDLEAMHDRIDFLIKAANNFERLVNVLELADNYVGFVVDGSQYQKARAAIDEAKTSLEWSK